MANIKFSQFTSQASLSATAQIVGFDGATNIRLTKAALEGSLTLGNLAGTIDLTSQVTNTLPVANGGTSYNTYSQGDILYGDSGGGLSRLASGAAGTILTSDGPTTDPSWVEPYLNSQIDYRSARVDIWGGTGSFGYANVSRGTKYAMGTEVNLTDYTTHPTSSGITYAQTDATTQPLPAGLFGFGTGGAYSKWTVEQGTYEITVTSFFYDNFTDLDTTVSVWLGVGGSWIEEYIVIKQSTGESSDSRMFTGSRVVTALATGWEFMVTILFENGGSDPFPYNASASTPPLMVSIKRI